MRTITSHTDQTDRIYLRTRGTTLFRTVTSDLGPKSEDVCGVDPSNRLQNSTVSVCVTSCTNDRKKYPLDRRCSSAVYGVNLNHDSAWFDRSHLPLLRLLSTFANGRTCCDIRLSTGTPIRPLCVTLTGAAGTAGRTQTLLFTLKAFKFTRVPSMLLPARGEDVFIGSWKTSLTLKLVKRQRGNMVNRIFVCISCS